MTLKLRLSKHDFYWIFSLLLICSYCIGNEFKLSPERNAPDIGSEYIMYYGGLSNTAYIAPNEHNLNHAISFLSDSPEGIYISVGTERSFMGAAASNATHLLTLDNSPETYVFNVMNSLLLKGASDIKHFRQLKFDPVHLSNSVQSLNLSDAEKAYLDLVVEGSFWERWVDKLKDNIIYHNKNEKGFLSGVNYHYNQASYKKLKLMAATGRVQSRIVSLDIEESYLSIVNQLISSGLQLSIFDISNAWEYGHIAPAQTVTLLKNFESISQPESKVLITKATELTAIDSSWDYLWSPFHNLVKQDRLDNLYKDDRSEPDPVRIKKREKARMSLLSYFTLIQPQERRRLFRGCLTLPSLFTR